MLKYRSNPRPVEVDSRIESRVINGLSRRNRHGAAIKVSSSRAFIRFFGRFALANSLYRAEYYAEAFVEFDHVYREHPGNNAVSKRLVTAALKSGDVRLQERAAETLIAVGWPAADELTRAADGIESSLGFEIAEKYYWHAFSEWHSDRAHAAIVNGLRREGANQWRLLQVMEAGEELHADDTSWTLNLAAELAKANRFSEATTQYERVAGSLAADQHYTFGYYFLRSDNPASARVAFRRAIDLDKKLSAVKYGIGAFHEEHKRWSLAARAFAEASSTTSDELLRAELHYRAGYCFEAALDLPDARRSYDRALEFGPRDKALWVCSGVAAELDGDYDDARKRYLVACGLSDSPDSSLSFRLGYVLWKLDQPVDALEHFARFVGVTDGLVGLEAHLDDDSFADNRSKRSSDILKLAAPKRRLGASAHVSWGDTFYEVECWESAARHYRLGFLSGGITRKKLRCFVEALVRLGRYEDACRTVVEWRANPEASPLKLESPRPDGIEARNISYEQFRRNLAVRQDVLMFESSLGLAVDCHPLSLSRYILKEFPGQFIHAWVVDGGTPLPLDLENQADVIVVQKGSVQETRLFASAGYIINNSTFPTHPVLRDEQRYMNTWHGTPLKAMMKDTPETLDYANISRNFLQATTLIYPSDYAKDKILGRTDLSDTVRADVEIIGSPRNDGLVQRRLSPDAVIAPNKQVLIAPTWRPESDLDYEVDKLLTLSQALSTDGLTVRVRAHHYVENEVIRRGLPLNIVPRSVPTNDLLETVDLLVTDYSSIFFDFAITRRPMVFFVPDWDEYSVSRGLYLKRNELPGAVCHTIEAVCDAVAVSQVYEGIDAFLEKFAPLEDGLATERATSLLFNGPTACELAVRAPADESVLFRGEFLANGISSALITMANALGDRGVRAGVLTGTEAVRNDPVRQRQLTRLHDSTPVIGRVGAMLNSQLQYHARRVLSREKGAPVSSLCSALVDDAYATEYRRILGTSMWSSVVEYEGYSEFWADFVLGSRNSNTSKSIFMHNDIAAEIEMKFPWMERIVKRYPRFDHAVSVSGELARINETKLGRILGSGDLVIQSARNIVDPERIERLGNLGVEADLEAFLGAQDPMILSVGRLSPEKNHKFLLRVARQVVDEVKDARFVICGEGPLKGLLASQISKLGLNDNVLLAGQRDNVYALMRRAEVFVLPSLHEGQPVVLLESSVVGTPALASDISSIVPFERFGVRTENLDVSQWSTLLIAHLRGERRLLTIDPEIDQYIESSVTEFRTAVGSFA